MLGAEVGDRQVTYDGHTTRLGVHPLGVDAESLRERAHADDVETRLTTLRRKLGDRKSIVRVDRTELSKNIGRGLLAYRELLRQYPEWRGKVTHLASAYPSRHDLPEYREYTAQVQRLAAEIEDEFGTDDWRPIVLDVTDDYARSLALYRVGDVLLVNPVRDGMNLVAKEVPAALRERLRGRALDRGRGGRRVRRRRAAGQPVRRVRARPTRCTGRCRCTTASAGSAPTGWPRPRPGCHRARWLADQVDALD